MGNNKHTKFENKLFKHKTLGFIYRVVNYVRHDDTGEVLILYKRNNIDYNPTLRVRSLDTFRELFEPYQEEEYGIDVKEMLG